MKKIQELQEMSTYDKRTIHDIFLMTMEWLEKYIEVAGCYPDWGSRKQIKSSKIKRTDIIGNPEKAKESFSTVLFILQANLQDATPKFREEVKKEFYQWISATGIDVNNCSSDELKNVLYQVNEILKGNGEKIQKDIENRKRDVEMDSPEYMEGFKKMFASVQDPLRNEKKEEKTWRGKTDKDWKKESKFSFGSIEQGEQIFSQIANYVERQQGDFYFYPQKNQQIRNPNYNPLVDDPSEEFLSLNSQMASSSGTSLGIHPTNLIEVVQEVKTNPQNWTLDEVITEINRLGWQKKKEVGVYCHHARLNDYNQEGKLNFNNNPIYLWENFNSRQRFEIKRAKNISSDYLTSEEIKWVIREFKENPRDWRIGVDKGQTYLIHNSAQGKDKKEWGTLIHNQQKFSNSEWLEISGTLERVSTASQSIRWDLVNRINQHANEFKLERVLVLNKRGDGYDEEDWVIYNSAERKTDQNGCLVFDSDKMFKIKDLTEAEQKAIGYKSEQDLQNSSVSTTEKDNDKGIGYGGIFAIIGVVSILLISSVVVVKKRLSKKSR